MNSRKKGTGRSLSEREKLAVARYWEEVKSEKPNMLVKEICDKASRIFDVNIILFSKLQFFFMNKSCFRFIRQLHAKSLMNIKALILLELQKRKDAVIVYYDTSLIRSILSHARV
jgi:hypothetical protein